MPFKAQNVQMELCPGRGRSQIQREAFKQNALARLRCSGADQLRCRLLQFGVYDMPRYASAHSRYAPDETSASGWSKALQDASTTVHDIIYVPDHLRQEMQACRRCDTQPRTEARSRHGRKYWDKIGAVGMQRLSNACLHPLLVDHAGHGRDADQRERRPRRRKTSRNTGDTPRTISESFSSRHSRRCCCDPARTRPGFELFSSSSVSKNSPIGIG